MIERSSVTVSDGIGTHAGLISRGEVSPLKDVPFHGGADAPITRRVLAGGDIFPQAEKRVVAHEMRAVSAASRDYCEPHVHDCPEINILLSMDHLVYEITLGDEVYEVEAPASIYIPAGLTHSANVIEGSGFFIAIIETADYVAKPPPGVAS
ncbi:cupin domain-containing protein [Gordonia jinghuaiqii]|uniref:homocitrate synthase n=1 Tax=Gordonia jinghuaiqii TaxID=2758710 RepID=UPI001CB78DBB|nr:homocitrate synthase [Gordonia jinghuaiqii]